MGFLQSDEAIRGYQRQDELIPLIEVLLLKEGYDCKVVPATMNEDMKEHIDAKIKCDYKPFQGYFTCPIDIKTGRTFTLYSHTGFHNLNDSKAIYLVYEVKEDDNYLIFVSVSKFRKLVEQYKPKLYRSKRDNSQYFWAIDFIDDHFEEFGPHEYFFLQK